MIFTTMKHCGCGLNTFNVLVWICLISNILVVVSSIQKNIRFGSHRQRRQVDCDGKNQVNCSLPPVNPTLTFTEKKQPTPTEQGSCFLPSIIQNGRWKIMGNSSVSNFQPGDGVPTNTIFKIECIKGFKIDGPLPFMLCTAGTWLPNVPKCVKICPKLESTATTFITCTNRGINVNCSEAMPHTVAKFSCAVFHELTTTYNMLRCHDGTWDLAKPVCVPACGLKIEKIRELISSGDTISRGSHPWSAVVYRKKDKFYEHICGATLISEKLILTAAHCVTNREGKKNSEDIYRVAAGKYYRAYDDIRDAGAQFTEVEKIFVPERYRGSFLDFEADIAILVTKVPFKTTPFVQRVCLDWNSNYEKQLQGKGTVVGWGHTVQKNKPSEVLKEISLSYIDFPKCFSRMPDNFKRYLRSDKMCTEVLDKDIGVCAGDGGGGIIFRNGENNRYYLGGILSLNFEMDGNCNSTTFPLLTKVSSYLDLIRSIELSYSD